MAGFPDEELHRYSELSEEADGHFYENHQGTMRFGLASAQVQTIETLKLNLRALLSEPAPPRMKAGVNLPRAEAEALDLVMTPDLPNAFGKTPLMVAAGLDELASARFLLDHGADPNLRTEQPLGPALGHDARTALMYAAARGSLAMIRLLVGAGADVHAADTKGVTVLDYLVGRGPLAANPKLSASELGEAARLLF